MRAVVTLTAQAVRAAMPSESRTTAIKAPEGVDGQAIVKTLRQKYGITIAGGQSELKGKVFRVALKRRNKDS